MVFPIDLTLAEQLRISEADIARRKQLLKFHDGDVAALVDCQARVAGKVDTIVHRFYEEQRQQPEFNQLIGDADTFNQLRVSMRRYIVELFDGGYDKDYVNNRLRIGKVHERIGVPPKLYISAVVMLEDVIVRILFEGDGQTEEADRSASRALHKLLMFDMQLVCDTYIASLTSQLEAAKDEAVRYADGLVEKTRELSELSRVDALTGLGNQRAFLDDFAREFSRAHRSQLPLALIYFDLNAFKQLNDSEGHTAGDRLLAMVGSTIRSSIRASDRGYRYGGDEFCVVLSDTDIRHARNVIDRMIGSFGSDVGGVTFSVGILEIDTSQDADAADLINAADRLMYRSKDRSKQSPGHHITAGTWPGDDGNVIVLRVAR